MLFALNNQETWHLFLYVVDSSATWALKVVECLSQTSMNTYTNNGFCIPCLPQGDLFLVMWFF